MGRTFIIGTRGSALALWQANFVLDKLKEAFPDRAFEIRVIRTTGDDLQQIALSKIGDKGLFTRQIEAELLDGSIDLAVHSLKDLQTEQPDGLTIGSVCEREIPNDVLISRQFASIDELPTGAKVATGSLRRRSQLLGRRPDLEVSDIRGNVPTRLEKFLASDLDAMILAYAGVFRLGLAADIMHVISADVMVPAVGQGAVAIETRAADSAVNELMTALDHKPTRACVMAERSFLRRLEGGCQVPIGAYAVIDGDQIELTGMVGGLDGKIVIRGQMQGNLIEPERLGIDLAERLIADGAESVLSESRALAEGAA